MLALINYPVCVLVCMKDTESGQTDRQTDNRTDSDKSIKTDALTNHDRVQKEEKEDGGGLDERRERRSIKYMTVYLVTVLNKCQSSVSCHNTKHYLRVPGAVAHRPSHTTRN